VGVEGKKRGCVSTPHRGSPHQHQAPPQQNLSYLPTHIHYHHHHHHLLLLLTNHKILSLLPSLAIAGWPAWRRTRSWRPTTLPTSTASSGSYVRPSLPPSVSLSTYNNPVQWCMRVQCNIACVCACVHVGCRRRRHRRGRPGPHNTTAAAFPPPSVKWRPIPLVYPLPSTSHPDPTKYKTIH
jgi:hypothetical protein